MGNFICEHNKAVHKDSRYSNLILLVMLFGPIAAFPSTQKQLGNYFLSGFYLSRGLTFFINHYQQKQQKSKTKPILSVTYDPQCPQILIVFVKHEKKSSDRTSLFSSD
jgi:hypothetical protein